MQTRRLSLAIAIAAALTSQAWADSKSSSFDSRVQVVATCSISAADLNFGSITTGTTGNVDASSSLTINCSANAPYQIALSNGANFDTSRRMAWGGSYVGYRLYSNAARTQEWGATPAVSGTGSGANQTHDIYGRIFAGQNVPNTGNYADTVVATVSY